MQLVDTRMPTFVVVEESGDWEDYDWRIVGVFENEPGAHAFAWKHAFAGQLRCSISVHAWATGDSHCISVSHLNTEELRRNWGGVELARMAAAVDVERGVVPDLLAGYCTITAPAPAEP